MRLRKSQERNNYFKEKEQDILWLWLAIANLFFHVGFASDPVCLLSQPVLSRKNTEQSWSLHLHFVQTVNQDCKNDLIQLVSRTGIQTCSGLYMRLRGVVRKERKGRNVREWAVGSDGMGGVMTIAPWLARLCGVTGCMARPGRMSL